jgi:hypothetical protein
MLNLGNKNASKDNIEYVLRRAKVVTDVFHQNLTSEIGPLSTHEKCCCYSHV